MPPTRICPQGSNSVKKHKPFDPLDELGRCDRRWAKYKCDYELRGDGPPAFDLCPCRLIQVRICTFAVLICSSTYFYGIVLPMHRRMTHRFENSPFHQPDPSMYLLALPKSRPRLGIWALFVFFAGILIALMLLAITNSIP